MLTKSTRKKFWGLLLYGGVLSVIAWILSSVFPEHKDSIAIIGYMNVIFWGGVIGGYVCMLDVNNHDHNETKFIELAYVLKSMLHVWSIMFCFLAVSPWVLPDTSSNTFLSAIAGLVSGFTFLWMVMILDNHTKATYWILANFMSFVTVSSIIAGVIHVHYFESLNIWINNAYEFGPFMAWIAPWLVFVGIIITIGNIITEICKKFPSTDSWSEVQHDT